MARKRDSGVVETSDEHVERYKQAANDALQQLDWCIGYLVGMRKQKVATTLASNRASIREHMTGEDAEPTPAADA